MIEKLILNSYPLNNKLMNVRVNIIICGGLYNVLTSYQKKEGPRSRARPFFGMTSTFKIFFLKSRCHTKRRAGAAMCARPSFGMTMTQAIRNLMFVPTHW